MDWMWKEDGAEGGGLGWLWPFGLGDRDWSTGGGTDFLRKMLDLVLNTAVNGISG